MDGQIVDNVPFQLNPPIEIDRSPPSSLPSTIVSFSSDERMIAEFKDLKAMIRLLRSAVEQQTQIIHQQNVKINTIYGKLFKITTTYNIPLQSINDLNDIEQKIKEVNFENDIKIYLKTFLQGKISKNLGNIMSDELLKLVNWNGRKNLIALVNYKFFSCTLYDALQHMYTSFDDYQSDFKVAIGRGKNRMDQKRHIEKRKANESLEISF